jgi:hypothetical protein
MIQPVRAFRSRPRSSRDIGFMIQPRTRTISALAASVLPLTTHYDAHGFCARGPKMSTIRTRPAFFDCWFVRCRQCRVSHDHRRSRRIGTLAKFEPGRMISGAASTRPVAVNGLGRCWIWCRQSTRCSSVRHGLCFDEWCSARSRAGMAMRPHGGSLVPPEIAALRPHRDVTFLRSPPIYQPSDASNDNVNRVQPDLVQ